LLGKIRRRIAKIRSFAATTDPTKCLQLLEAARVLDALSKPCNGHQLRSLLVVTNAVVDQLSVPNQVTDTGEVVGPYLQSRRHVADILESLVELLERDDLAGLTRLGLLASDLRSSQPRVSSDGLDAHDKDELRILASSIRRFVSRIRQPSPWSMRPLNVMLADFEADEHRPVERLLHKIGAAIDESRQLNSDAVTAFGRSKLVMASDLMATVLYHLQRDGDESTAALAELNRASGAGKWFAFDPQSKARAAKALTKVVDDVIGAFLVPVMLPGGALNDARGWRQDDTTLEIAAEMIVRGIRSEATFAPYISDFAPNRECEEAVRSVSKLLYSKRIDLVRETVKGRQTTGLPQALLRSLVRGALAAMGCNMKLRNSLFAAEKQKQYRAGRT
jgi:hypothetical protein